MPNQTLEMKNLILHYLKNGYTRKSVIYDLVLKEIPEVKRPAVRRACRALRLELKQYVSILEKDTVPQEKLAGV